MTSVYSTASLFSHFTHQYLPSSVERTCISLFFTASLASYDPMVFRDDSNATTYPQLQTTGPFLLLNVDDVNNFALLPLAPYFLLSSRVILQVLKYKFQLFPVALIEEQTTEIFHQMSTESIGAIWNHCFLTKCFETRLI